MTKEPITQLFTMNGNEYERVETFKRIEYQAYLCWSNLDSYDNANSSYFR